MRVKIFLFLFYCGTTGTEDYRGSRFAARDTYKGRKSGFFFFSDQRKRHGPREDEKEAFYAGEKDGFIGAEGEMEQANEKKVIWFGGGI